MAKLKLETIVGALITIVLLLALTVPMVNMLESAKYGNSQTDAQVIDTAVSNSTTLTYGNIRNETGYIAITLNATDSEGNTTLSYYVQYTVTSVGDYTTGAVIAFSTLNATTGYLATIIYDYLLPVEQVALLTILPIVWVIVLVVSLAMTLVILVKSVKRR